MNLQRFAQERTEPASPRKVEKARQRGQVFKSTELISAITLLATYFALQTAGPIGWRRLLAFGQRQFSQPVPQPLGQADLQHLAITGLVTTLIVAGPILAVALAAGMVANYLQVGFLFTLQPLAPNFSRVNPAQGLQRIFSRRSVVELLKGLAKIVLIGYIAYATVRGQLDQLPQMLNLSADQILSRGGSLVLTLVLRAALALLAVAVIDYMFQRYDYLSQMKMSKQEVKEEFRETEGRPEIKARFRRRQRELARRRMMQEVPRADVVVTNPTHVAVALKYESETMDAPKVVAKGRGYVARRIRAVAAEHQVPIVENPPLARTLHAAVEIDQAIPGDLYQAVAEVLAHVYRLKGMV